MKRYGEITIEIDINLSGAHIEEVRLQVNKALAAVNLNASDFECVSTTLTTSDAWGEDEEQERRDYNAAEERADAQRKYGER